MSASHLENMLCLRASAKKVSWGSFDLRDCEVYVAVIYLSVIVVRVVTVQVIPRSQNPWVDAVLSHWCRC